MRETFVPAVMGIGERVLSACGRVRLVCGAGTIANLETIMVKKEFGCVDQ